MTNKLHTSKNDAKDIVLSYVRALNEEDFDAARDLVSDDLTFDGVMGSRRGAAAYFKDMGKMKLKYKVKKAFADGDDVCLLYDVAMQEGTAFTCGWYHLENGKISSLKVVFDPRPMLQSAPKK